jgi:hypothetical protein
MTRSHKKRRIPRKRKKLLRKLAAFMIAFVTVPEVKEDLAAIFQIPVRFLSLPSELREGLE